MYVRTYVLVRTSGQSVRRSFYGLFLTIREEHPCFVGQHMNDRYHQRTPHPYPGLPKRVTTGGTSSIQPISQTKYRNTLYVRCCCCCCCCVYIELSIYFVVSTQPTENLIIYIYIYIYMCIYIYVCI
jgi:hypothetical protein